MSNRNPCQYCRVMCPKGGCVKWKSFVAKLIKNDNSGNAKHADRKLRKTDNKCRYVKSGMVKRIRAAEALDNKCFATDNLLGIFGLKRVPYGQKKGISKPYPTNTTEHEDCSTRRVNYNYTKLDCQGTEHGGTK